MLTDEAIEKLIEPIVNRQQNISNYIIQLIARRVKEIGELLPSDLYKLERLFQMGADAKQINAELAKLTNLQTRDIKNLIRRIAEDSYYDVKPFYDYRHITQVPFIKNKELQRVVTAIANETANTCVNLSDSRMIGFDIRDMKNPTKIKFQSVANTYKSVIDEAVQSVRGGVLDYDSAMQKTMEQLSDSGLRVRWDSGYTQRLDTAVRRNILEGVKRINQGVQDEVGRQFDADGKEITVHANSAPDHEPIQGHQFTNTEYEKLQNGEPFEDVNGIKFDAIARAIGTLNCRHFTYSIIIGVSEPIYSQEQLDKLIANNQKGITLSNGKHLTRYECLQYQRRLETNVRYAKDGIRMAKILDNQKLLHKYETRLSNNLQKYQAFCKKCGVRMQTDRLGGRV